MLTPRQVQGTVLGLLMGMFVGILAETVVATALPRIVHDLHGGQAAYSWVVTSTLLAMTVSTPIWGKLSDLVSRKLLVQLSFVVYVVGTVLAGLSQNAGTLISFRAMQGLGAGGMAVLAQVILVDILPARERGRYMGYLGAVLGVGTGMGPLVGGAVTDAIGWRWTFFITLPFAIAAIILVQRSLKLPTRHEEVKIDYVGAVIISAGVALLLVWVSFVGTHFSWGSSTSLVMVTGAVVLLVIACLVELKVKEPIIPMSLFRNRTFTLVIVASVSLGIALYGISVFLSQYLQLSRALTPTQAGANTLPFVAGLLIASMGSGALISRTGFWKRWLILGGALLTTGLGLMSTMRYDTNIFLVFTYMAIAGLGIGMVMQNMVLVLQNAVHIKVVGTAGAGAAFFRTLGGAIGVAALGAVSGTRALYLVHSGLDKIDISGQASGLSGGTIPDVSTLHGPVRALVQASYGQAVGESFLIATPLAAIALIAMIFLPNLKLRTKTGIEELAEVGAVDLQAAEGVSTSPADTVIEIGLDRESATVREDLVRDDGAESDVTK